MRRRRIPEKPWKQNWRNPDLPINTRVLEERGFSMYEKVAVEMDPYEMQGMCQESIRDSGNPEFTKDPSYNWARPGARKQR